LQFGHQAILLQAKPGELIVATLQVRQPVGQPNFLDAIDSTYPGIEIAANQVILAQAAASGLQRLPQARQADTCGAGRRIANNG
jgi:hypothetical protein